MYTVVGIERRKGTYEGFAYDNVLLHCSSPLDPKKGTGSFVITIKIKAENVDTLPDLGDVINPLYDRYGRCIKI